MRGGLEEGEASNELRGGGGPVCKTVCCCCLLCLHLAEQICGECLLYCFCVMLFSVALQLTVLFALAGKSSLSALEARFFIEFMHACVYILLFIEPFLLAARLQYSQTGGCCSLWGEGVGE